MRSADVGVYERKANSDVKNQGAILEPVLTKSALCKRALAMLQYFTIFIGLP